MSPEVMETRLRVCCYLSGDRHDDVVKGSEVVRVTHPPSAPGYVDVEPRPLGHTHPVRGSVHRRREECPVVIAMERDVQDAGNG